MEIIGKLALILPEQRGEGARGPWVRGRICDRYK